MIRVEKISKTFGKKRVLDDLNLQINKGEIFGLLGPNAAGKTTTIRILCNLLRASSGEAYIDNIALSDNSDALQYKIAYVAQSFGLYDELSVLENIEFYSNLYGVATDETLLNLLTQYQIIEFKDAKAGTLSGGYKRRLSLCCALSHNPDVIFLDEPTAGIDPVTRKALWDIFYDLSQEGKTLFVTTHYMEEAQRCHKIAFLNHGKKVIEGTPNEVRNSLQDFTVYKNTQKFEHALLQTLRSNSNIHFVNQFGDELRIVVKKEFTQEQLSSLMSPYIDDAIHLATTTPNLEDVFIALTQEESR